MQEEQPHYRQSQSQYDWSIDLVDSIWFHISNYLNINDIHRLSRTCSRLHSLLISNDFWSYLTREQFGNRIWNRSLTFNIDRNFPHSDKTPCRSKLIYFELVQRKRISFSDFNLFSFDTNRSYSIVDDSSSHNGHVLYIKDSIEMCYSLHIETLFENILPGKYDVIWRMKLNAPYMLGETDFFAAAEQANPKGTACMRWYQEDFLSMYRLFYCDISKTTLWFYQTIGIIEINGDKPCNVFVSMTNHDSMHAKYGVYLDYVELKLVFE